MIRNETSTRFTSYIQINPSLSTHPLYTQKFPLIPDYLRTDFTRLRLSSHRLMIEKGRWSRTPREDRLCSCGLIQDEHHIVVCTLNEQIIKDFDYKDSSLGLQGLFVNVDLKRLKLISNLLKNLEERH